MELAAVTESRRSRSTSGAKNAQGTCFLAEQAPKVGEASVDGSRSRSLAQARRVRTGRVSGGNTWPTSAHLLVRFAVRGAAGPCSAPSVGRHPSASAALAKRVGSSDRDTSAPSFDLGRTMGQSGSNPASADTQSGSGADRQPLTGAASVKRSGSSNRGASASLVDLGRPVRPARSGATSTGAGSGSREGWHRRLEL